MSRVKGLHVNMWIELLASPSHSYCRLCEKKCGLCRRSVDFVTIYTHSFQPTNGNVMWYNIYKLNKCKNVLTEGLKGTETNKNKEKIICTAS